MTKYCARFHGQPSEVVEKLCGMGLMLRNPNGNFLQAFGARDGDFKNFKNEEEAQENLVKGKVGLSFWLAENFDFFVSNLNMKLVGYFDGFTENEQAEFERKLIKGGLTFDVLHEEEL